MDSERHSKSAVAAWEPLSDVSVLLWKIAFAVVCKVQIAPLVTFQPVPFYLPELVMEMAVKSIECFMLVTVTNVILLNSCFVQLLNCIHFVIEYLFPVE